MHVFNLKLFSYVFVELRVFKVGGVVLAGGRDFLAPIVQRLQQRTVSSRTRDPAARAEKD